MKPRPLYRSFTFWAGIFMLIFLAVAWVDSKKYYSFGIAEWKGEKLEVSSVDDTVGFTAIGTRDRGWSWSVGRSDTDSMSLAEWDSPFLWPRFETWPLQDSKMTYQLVLPYLLIVALVIVGWGSILLWRTRRIRRAIRSAPAAP